MAGEFTSASVSDFILYIEGVFVPLIRADVTSAIGRPATANISIPATDLSMLFEPRSSVHLFYADPHDLYPDSEIESRRSLPKYKLLFEGEILGKGFRKTISSRETVLYCMDIGNNFDFAQKFVLQGGPSIPGISTYQAFTGTGTKISVQDTPVASEIMKVVSSEASIVDGVKSLIDEVFGGDGSKVKTNEFYQSVQTRFKISDKVVSLPDSDIVKLALSSLLPEVANRFFQGKSSVYSLGEMINTFLGVVQYQRSSILAPKKGASFNSIVLAPNVYFAPPPKCNVLFPNHITSIGYDDQFMKAPTRFILQPSSIGFATGTNEAIVQTGFAYMVPYSLTDLLPTGSKFSPGQDSYLSIITDEERVKGLVPGIKQIGAPEFAATMNGIKDADAAGSEPGSTRNFMINLAEYEYDLARAASKTISPLAGGFNPDPVVGMPAAILDSSFDFFALLVMISHSFSAENGGSATTSYTFDLPRQVTHANRKIGNLTEAADAALSNLLSRVLYPDKNAPAAERQRVLDISGYITVIRDGGASSDAIRFLERINKSTIDERESIVDAFIHWAETGVYDDIPSFPRWVNSKFKGQNASAAYKELYGCGSVLDPLQANKTYSSMAEAVAGLSAQHGEAEDPAKFARDYTRRSGVVTQTDFELYYGLPSIANQAEAYPTLTGGIFTENRQAIVRQYVSELDAQFAHLG